MKEQHISIQIFDQLNDAAKELLRRGAKLIGPATGATLGVITKDPTAVVLSAAVGSSIADVINDYAERALSKKQKDNISIVEVFAIVNIIKYQNAGGQLHAKIFEPGISGNAKELYDGLLSFAKNNYEDKKLEILGKSYAGALYSPIISPPLLGLLISQINSLSYQQLCLLSIIGQHEKYENSLASLEELEKKKNWYEIRIIQNLISNFINDGTLIPHNTAMLIYVKDRHINNARLSSLGKMLFELGELNEIEEEDLEDILQLFRLP